METPDMAAKARIAEKLTENINELRVEAAVAVGEDSPIPAVNAANARYSNMLLEAAYILDLHLQAILEGKEPHSG